MSPHDFTTDAPLASAAVVDRLLADFWKSRGIEPASPAEDAEFLRRLTLDLVGRGPTVAEQDRYFADATDRRRAVAVERLLASPEFALHFARVLDDWIQRSRKAGTRVELVPAVLERIVPVTVLVTMAIGVVSAATLFVAFFPPERYRRWLEARAAART